MESSNDNLNNPMVVDTIDLSLNYNRRTIKLTKKEYDLIPTKDPTCIYIVKDETDIKPTYYLGDCKIRRDFNKDVYLLGPSNKFGEYTMYLYTTECGGVLIEICRYNDPNIAIGELIKANKNRSTDKLYLQVRNMLIEYIKGNININDLLIGIISAFGYKDSPKLQDLISTIRSYSMIKFTFVVLNILARSDDNPLAGLYVKLHDLILSYDYFKGKKFKKEPEDIDLGEIIDKIFNIMNTPCNRISSKNNDIL